MPAIKYKVSLSEDEKQYLQALIRKGTSAARSQTRARILLKAAEGVQNKAIIQALGVFAVNGGQDPPAVRGRRPGAALTDHPRPGQTPKLTHKQAAHLIAIACSAAPEGHTHWTLRLLAGKVGELAYAPSCSYETIRQLLKKHAEAMAATGMVHPRSQRRVRGGHGRRAGSLWGTL